MLRTANKRLYIGKPLGQAFGPANPLPVTTNLQAWYDCSDLSTLAITSNKVSQWDDKSGNGFNLTQATAGNRPLYNSSPRTINGITVPEFATTLYMDSSCPADDRTSTTFVACRLDTLATQNQVYGSSSSGGIGLRVVQSTGQLRTLKDGVAFLTDGQRVLADPLLICHRWTATTIEQFLMGTNQLSSDSTALTASTTLRLGGEVSGTSGWDGLIPEFLRYSVTLTDAEVDAVMLYLWRKWFQR